MAIEVGDAVYMASGPCPGMTVASVDEYRAECWWFDGELHLCKGIFPIKVLALSKKREEEFVVDNIQTQRFPDGFVRVTTEGRVKDRLMKIHEIIRESKSRGVTLEIVQGDLLFVKGKKRHERFVKKHVLPNKFRILLALGIASRIESARSLRSILKRADAEIERAGESPLGKERMRLAKLAVFLETWTV